MNTTKHEIRSTYEMIADSFAGTRTRPWDEVREFIDRLPRAARVLDLGCGNGRHARLFAAQGHPTVGLDFSRRLLVIGRRDERREESPGRIAWLEAEGTTLPLRDGTFDACLCVAVLHHLPTRGERLAALREIRRVLRPDGVVFVSVWSREQPRFATAGTSERVSEDGDVQVPWTMPDGSSIPRFYHLFQEGELERLIIESGLQGERFFSASGNHFAMAKNDG